MTRRRKKRKKSRYEHDSHAAAASQLLYRHIPVTRHAGLGPSSLESIESVSVRCSR